MLLTTSGPRRSWHLQGLSLAVAWGTLAATLGGPLTATAQPAAKTATAAPAARPYAVLPDPPYVGKYDTLPPDPSARLQPYLQTLNGEKFGEPEKDLIRLYLTRYWLARWTYPDYYPLLPKLRREIRPILQSTKDKTRRQWLVQYLIDEASKLSSGNYHPTVRVNAALLIGELTADEPAKPTDPPVLYPPAATALIDILRDPQQILSVKIAALTGLQRHAEAGLGGEEARADAVALCTGLINALPPSERLNAGFQWMRAQAADVLGAIGEAGENGSAALALARLAGASSAPMSARSAAARALGRLNYQPVNVNAANLTLGLGQLELAACRQAKDDLAANRPTAGVLRQLRGITLNVQLGFNGSGNGPSGVQGAAKDDKQKAAVKKIGDIVNEAAKAMESKDCDVGGVANDTLARLSPLVDRGN